MSIDPNLLRKRLSEARWHLNMSQDVDSNLYAAVDGLADLVGDLIRALPAAVAPTEPAKASADLSVTAAGLSGERSLVQP